MPPCWTEHQIHPAGHPLICFMPIQSTLQGPYATISSKLLEYNKQTNCFDAGCSFPVAEYRKSDVFPMQTQALQLRVGYELIYYLPQDVPMILLVNIHHSRAFDIIVPDQLTTDPSIPFTTYRDSFRQLVQSPARACGTLAAQSRWCHPRQRPA